MQEKDRQAAEWMVENDVAVINDSGQLLLQSTALLFKTTVSRPALVRDPPQRCDCSLWSLRRFLKRGGWDGVESARLASVQHRAFNETNQSTAYYTMLIDSHLQKHTVCVNKMI